MFREFWGGFRDPNPPFKGDYSATTRRYNLKSPTFAMPKFPQYLRVKNTWHRHRPQKVGNCIGLIFQPIHGTRQPCTEIQWCNRYIPIYTRQLSGKQKSLSLNR